MSCRHGHGRLYMPIISDVRIPPDRMILTSRLEDGTIQVVVLRLDDEKIDHDPGDEDAVR